MRRPDVLIIAGTDSSGGAGLLRDIAVTRDLGIQARCAVTAVTAQSDKAVAQSLSMPPGLVAAQLAASLSDTPPSAIKIGMLGNADSVMAVASALRGRDIPVVLDPVLASSSGTALMTRDGVAAMIERLLPLCALVTPNLSEASALAGPADDTPALRAGRLRSYGADAVLIKGGHGRGRLSTDILFDGHGQQLFSAHRLPGTRRGTGCTMSTAIACFLASGKDLRQACDAAKRYTHRWISAAETPDRP